MIKHHHSDMSVGAQQKLWILSHHEPWVVVQHSHIVCCPWEAIFDNRFCLLSSAALQQSVIEVVARLRQKHENNQKGKKEETNHPTGRVVLLTPIFPGCRELSTHHTCIFTLDHHAVSSPHLPRTLNSLQQTLCEHILRLLLRGSGTQESSTFISCCLQCKYL